MRDYDGLRSVLQYQWMIRVVNLTRLHNDRLRQQRDEIESQKRINKMLDRALSYEVYAPVKSGAKRIKSAAQYKVLFIVQFDPKNRIRRLKSPSPALPRSKIGRFILTTLNRGGNSPSLLQHKFFKLANTLHIFL